MYINPNEYWNKFEDTVIGEHNTQLENIIYDLMKQYEKSNDATKLEEMKKEQKLLNIFFHNLQSHVWEWALNNPNKPFPEWKKDDVTYYEDRRDKTRNLLHKARYSYAIWTVARKNPNDAKLAVENFVKIAEVYGDKKNLNVFQDDEMVRFLEISKKLALTLNLSEPHDAKSIFKKTHEILKKQNSIAEHKIGVCSALIGLLTRCGNELLNSKYAKDAEILQILKEVMSLIDDYVNDFRKRSSIAGEENFLQKKLEIAKIMKDSKLVKDVKLSIARLIEKRAEEAGSNVGHSILLQDAAKIYHELGMNSKVSEIAKQCETDVKKAMEGGEFTEVPIFSVEIKTGEISNKYKKSLIGKKAADILLKITLDDISFIPNWQKVFSATQEDIKKHPLSTLFQTIEFTDTLPSRQIESDEKKLVLHANKDFLGYSSIGMSLFGEIIRCLLESKQIEKKDIVNFLKLSVNVDQNEVPLIENAICYYIDGDHVAFSHVIMPRIESMMRALVKKLGGSALTYDSQELGFDQRLMGGLIKELEPLIDEDLHKHLDVWLGSDGQNIRNKISHGWMKEMDFNDQLSEILLYTILRLSMA